MYCLAANSSIKENVAKKLVLKKDKIIQWTLASNASLPEEVYYSISKGEHLNVLDELCRNPSTPGPVLNALAKRKELQLTIALNKNTPSFTLNYLLESKDNIVKKAALKNPNVSESALEKFKEGVEQKARAVERIITTEVISALPDMKYEEKMIMAISSSTNLAILSILALDEDPRVREAVLNNYKAIENFGLFRLNDLDF